MNDKGQFHRKCYHRVKKRNVCFLLKINEEGLYFDDEVKKVGNNMTSISFSALKRDHNLQEL